MSILKTKLLIPPPRSKQIHRARLLQQLDMACDYRCVLVCAPAGFGKTTLVSEFASANKRHVAWLALDTYDNDPSIFLLHLVAALQTIKADVGVSVMRALQSPQAPPATVVILAVLNDIAAQSTPLTLVLDDYHQLVSPLIDEAMTFMTANLPAQLSLVIVSREEPRLPLHTLRARNALLELRASDLRFDATESGQFLMHTMGLSLTRDDIAVLDARTEGWVAGLQLAALSIRSDRDPASAIKRFSGGNRFVADFLVAEVLRRQPVEIQIFLLRSAILDRMCGALCDAVVGDPLTPGQRTLEELERANLFVIPLDSERIWYRYHPLFAELLRQRLAQGSGPTANSATDIESLHGRASQWFAGHGLDLEAFCHAIAANDIDSAGRLIDGAGHSTSSEWCGVHGFALAGGVAGVGVADTAVVALAIRLHAVDQWCDHWRRGTAQRCGGWAGWPVRP